MTNRKQTLEYLHYAAQVPGAVGRTFSEPRDDFGHTTLQWDAGSGAMLCQPLEGTTGRLGLRMRDLTLVWVDGSNTTEFALHGRTLGDGYTFATQCLRQAGLTEALDMDAGYELDSSPLQKGAPFDAGDTRSLAWYADAYASAARLLTELRSDWDGASVARCWPHHFDVAVLRQLESGDIEEARSIGTGFSPGDGSYDQAYWYVTPWPYPAADALPEIAHGSWHTDHWIGAVLMHEGQDESSISAFASQAHQILRGLLNV